MGIFFEFYWSARWEKFKKQNTKCSDVFMIGFYKECIASWPTQRAVLASFVAVEGSLLVEAELAVGSLVGI